MTQSEALNILKLGKNVFLTGAAGSGKTFVLNKYVDYLKSHGVDVAVTASTGIAATQQSFPGYVLVDPHLAEFGTPQCDASRLYCSVKVSVVYVSAGTIKWVRTVINSPRSNLYLSDGVTPRRKVLLTCVDQLGRWEWWTAAVSDRY
jgi:Cdc6-like AAA superfamily ATPase